MYPTVMVESDKTVGLALELLSTLIDGRATEKVGKGQFEALTTHKMHDR